MTRRVSVSRKSRLFAWRSREPRAEDSGDVASHLGHMQPVLCACALVLLPTVLTNGRRDSAISARKHHGAQLSSQQSVAGQLRRGKEAVPSRWRRGTH